MTCFSRKWFHSKLFSVWVLWMAHSNVNTASERGCCRWILQWCKNQNEILKWRPLLPYQHDKPEWLKNDPTWANNLHLFCPFRTAIHDPTQKIRQREWCEGEISQSSAWAATNSDRHTHTHTQKVDQRQLVIVCTVGKLAFCQINAECKYTAAVNEA